MASALLRHNKILLWITPPAIGLTYHMSMVKAADNVNKKVDPKELDIYNKTDEQQSRTKPEEDHPTAFEEQISRGRKFVWKHVDTAKKTTGSTSRSFKKFVENTQEFIENLQTNRILQVKTGAITIATLTGLLLAGKGRRPLRRVFFAGGLGTAAAALCYPNKAGSVAKDTYHKVTSLFQGYKTDSSASGVKENEKDDMFRTGETVMLEEAIILSQLVYDELRKRIHVDDIHFPDFKAVCNAVVEEILLGIEEDFEIQTGGAVGRKHVQGTAHPPHDVLLEAQDITKWVVQEILDAIDEDMEIQTGGVHQGIPTIALDSTVLAKEISARVTKSLEDDLSASPSDQRAFLFSDPDKLGVIVSDAYQKCVEAAISAQVKTGRCHVILHSIALAAKTGAELRDAIDVLKGRRSADLESERPVVISDSRVVSERIATSLLDFIENHIKTSREKDYAFSEAGHIIRRASEGATKAVTNDIKESGAGVKGRKMRIALDVKGSPRRIGDEITDTVNEDIEIQTGAPEAQKPKAPRKPSPKVEGADSALLDGVLLSPIYAPGAEQIAEAIANEISEALHGRGVVVSELKHMAQVITSKVLDAINEDIEIQTGGWSAREHKPHAVLDAKELVKMAAKEVLQAIGEDMNIQTGDSLEKSCDLFLDSARLSEKIVDAIMKEVERDMKKPGASDLDEAFLFSLPQQLGELATRELEENIEARSSAIGGQISRIHVDVESLADGVGHQLKERIEASYIRAKAMGDVSNEREIAVIDMDEIRKKVSSTVKKALGDNPQVTPRPGNEPLHVVEEFGNLAERVVEKMTKAIQEDIEVQAGRERRDKRLKIVIDARQLAKKFVEEIKDALQEDVDKISEDKQEPESKPAKGPEPGNPGQSEPEDKDMYSTRSS